PIFFIGNLALDLVLERHDQFHGVERIGTEILDERRFVLDVAFVYAELLGDDLLDPLLNVFHDSSRGHRSRWKACRGPPSPQKAAAILTQGNRAPAMRVA